MYFGTVGGLSAVRKGPFVNVISGTRFESEIRDNRLIVPVSYQIESFIKENALAMIDTGSTESVICLPDARKKITEEPYSSGAIRWLSGQTETVYYYESKLKFPHGVEIGIDLIDVYEGLAQIADVVIGLDIISMGKLIVDGKNHIFSFEV